MKGRTDRPRLFALMLLVAVVAIASQQFSAQKAKAATGLVQFIGSTTESDEYPGGLGSQNIADGDFNTFWSGLNPNGSWVGYDLGTSSVVTEYAFTGRPDGTDPMATYTLRLVGAQLRASNNADFSSPEYNLDVIPAFPYYPRSQYNLRTTGTTTLPARYWSFTAPNGNYGTNFAELRLIGPAGTTAFSQPLSPTISPWGGRFTAGTTTVTMSDQTTSASIYYTTDGSTPSHTHGTLYTGPFTLSIGVGATTTVKAIAYDPSLSSTTSQLANPAYFSGYGYAPSDNWYDDRGILLESHGGGVFDNTSRDGHYYWYGSFTNNVNSSANAGNDTAGNKGVWLYSSTDLYNWTFVGQILDNTSADWYWIERPHVIYNATTSTYVLWAHGANNHDATDRAVIATASSPAGPWTWVNVGLNPDALGFKDDNLFQDGNGPAYVIYTEGDQNAIIVSQLSNDYLSTDGNHVTVLTGSREGAAMFNENGVYFLVNSVSNYYNSGSTYDERYSTTTNPLGTWGPNTSLFSSDPLGTPYNGQSSFVLKIPGKVNGYLYAADSWSNTSLYSSRQVWLPLSFPATGTVSVLEPATWDLSAFANVVAVPSVTTSAASSVGQASAALNASITSTGGQNATQSGFAWGTDPTLVSGVSTTTDGAQIGGASFSHSLSSLTCATAYYFRAYATNTAGTGYGSAQPFTTSACASSNASSEAVSGPAGGSASASELASLLAPSAAATAYLNSLAAVNPFGCPSGFICTPLPAVQTATVSSSAPALFTRDLSLGSSGADVAALQRYLNGHGFPVAPSGPGSLNHETLTFGFLTQAALARFQKAKGISPAVGYFGPMTRAYVQANP